MTHPSSPTDTVPRRPDAVDAPGAWRSIDHVQLAIPVGGEDEARGFWVDLLGFVEQPKPPVMAARGGAWFEAGDVRIHVGAEAHFVPARKAHPALVVGDLVRLIERTGLVATWNTEIAGLVRCHVDDPFGNRIELVDAEALAATGADADRSAETGLS